MLTAPGAPAVKVHALGAPAVKVHALGAPAVKVRAFNPSTLGQPRLHSEFQAKYGYIVWPCLRKQTKKQNHEEN